MHRARDDQVVFLYKVAPGLCTRAYSTRCMLDAGLPESIVQRVIELEKHEEEQKTQTGVGHGSLQERPQFVGTVAPAPMPRAETRHVQFMALVDRLVSSNFDSPGAIDAFMLSRVCNRFFFRSNEQQGSKAASAGTKKYDHVCS